jgi:hypothetical protein
MFMSLTFQRGVWAGWKDSPLSNHGIFDGLESGKYGTNILLGG